MTHETHDPLGYDKPLSLSAKFYPLGFPLIIETNSPAILRLAESLWSRWPAREGVRAARFRIDVDEAPAALSGWNPPAVKGQGHLVSIVSSPGNFAVADMTASFAFACLTPDVAADAESVRYHFLEPLAYLMIDAAFLSPLHASCVALNGNAVVMCGDSGAGKTSLAYACARLGWTYLSDDATHIIRGRPGHRVAGRPYRIRFRESARELFPELKEFVPRRRPNGKLDIEVDTCELKLNVSPESSASHVVFLDRKTNGNTAQLEPFPTSLAATKLQELVCYGDANIRSEQREALAGFLRLPVFKLTYSDPASAEQVLRKLLEAEGQRT